MKNKIEKILNIFLIILIIANYGFTLIAYSNEKTDAYLIKIGTADKHLKYFREETEMSTYVVCSIVGYKENNEFYPAYCMDKKLPGAETSEYIVNLEEITPENKIIKNSKEINNNAIWRVIKNGYPYKTAEEMGLNSDFDAFAVTKFAIYCILGESDLDYYSCDDDDEIGMQMLDKLKELVDIGLNGTESLDTKYITINKNGDIYKEGSNYIQKYKVESSREIKEEYNIEIINNENITIQKEDKNNFKVLIPEELMENNIYIEFKIEAEVEKYPVFYGITSIPNTQDYIVTAEKYSTVSEILKSQIKTNISKIEITKVDEENLEPISNTNIQLLNENREIIEERTTNENGKIIFEDLFKGKYILREIDANKNYIKNEEDINIDLQYNETKKVQIENTHKKGNIKIIKLDKDNKKLTLGGIEFELFNEKNEFVGKYTTDLNGEILIEDINIGKYFIKEIEAKNGYELPDIIETEVKYLETTNLEILNEKTKGKVRVIKSDKDNCDKRISGVEFVILDENKNEVERIVTDSNGEAVSKDLALYGEKYYLKEIKTKDEYILNDKEIELSLKGNIITNINIENEIKKGKIIIKKVDFDTFKPLAGIKFLVINSETNEKIEEIETNEKGEAISSYLPINQEYILREEKPIDGYKALESDIVVIPKWNEETIITVTNEKEKGRVKIIKVDKEDNSIKLSGVKFALYNNDYLEEVLITDEQGIAYSKYLYVNGENYYLIEIEGKDGYILNPDKIEFEILANKTTELLIENERNIEIKEEIEEPENIKKLPRTGF